MTTLSIIIPAYNEAQAIRAGKLAQVSEWLAGQPLSWELIVVDDGSRDETVTLARPLASRVIGIRHSGKAAAIVAGIREARGEVILFTDMDQATPITEAPKLLEALKQGADVAIGSRGLVRQGAPLGRYLLSWGHVALRGVTIGLRVSDTQCGFKAAYREAALHVIQHLHIYHYHNLCIHHRPSVTSGFDVEFLFVAKRLGYRIREVSVGWSYQEARHAALFKDAWRGIVDLGHILLERWKGGYPKPHEHGGER